jgi:hypothetical protein
MAEEVGRRKSDHGRGSRLVGPAFALVLLGLLGVVYAPSLEHTPRADHWDFLLDTLGRDTFADTFAQSYSYNRTRRIGPGDTELFRPILFTLLAAEKAVFGTHFACYQAVGILLHWGVACLLLILLKTILAREDPTGGAASSPPSRASRLLPYGVCLFFALNKSVVELVIWSHLHGYLLFLIFLLGSLTLLLRCAGRAAAWKSPRLWGSWMLGLLAAFTYELGQVYALLAGLFLAAALPPGTARRRRLAFASLFAAIGVLYQGADALDRWTNRGQFDPKDARGRILAGAFSKETLANSQRFIAYTALQPFFPSMWTGALEHGHLRIEEVKWGRSRSSLFHPAFATSALTVALAAGLGLIGLVRLFGRPDKRLSLLFLLAALFAAYLAAIVLGRLNRRAFVHLSCNSYYVYSGLLLALVPAFVAWLAAGRNRTAAVAQAALLLGMMALSAYDVPAVWRLNAAVAADLNACPDGGTGFSRRVARIERFIRRHEGEPGFSLGFDFDSCRALGTHHGVPLTTILFHRYLSPCPKYVVAFPDGEPEPMTCAGWQRSRGPQRRLCPELVAFDNYYNFFRVDDWYYGVQQWDGCYDPSRRDHAYLIRDRTLEGAMRQEAAKLAEQEAYVEGGWLLPPLVPITCTGRFERWVAVYPGPRYECVRSPWKRGVDLCKTLHYRPGCFDAVRAALAE